VFQLKKHVPELKIEYNVDSRQEIADSWPMVLQTALPPYNRRPFRQVFDDSLARAEWDWKHTIGLEQLVEIMITNLRSTLRHHFHINSFSKTSFQESLQ
jgi:hypothetical protein